MFNINDLVWLDFESASALDLKAARDPPLRHRCLNARDRSGLRHRRAHRRSLGMPTARSSIGTTRRDDLRARLRLAARPSPRGMRASIPPSGITQRSDFPSSTPERVIDPMIQAGVSNLPTDLESASRALGGAGKQKDGKKLIQTVLHRGRRAPRASRGMAAFSRLCAPGRRGDARRLPPDATAAA